MAEEKIGRYEIKSELGRGGMATVYLAYDPTFERDIAIKVLPAAFLHDPQFRIRFEREAKMIASLEHPAIVPVYDFGEQDGQPFIVMRYMAGGSLADRINQGALGLEESAKIISRLATALDAAHARGIVHRDLKPGNILFDQYGNAFLSDFGIARFLQSGSATITGENVLGTPAYMSPEQIQGEKSIDGRSDIYALGILVFQMLTGDTPFKSDTPAKTMMMHLLEPVPSIIQQKGNLDPAIDTIIGKALAKSPSDRYTTVSEFASYLEQASTDVTGFHGFQAPVSVAGNQMETSLSPGLASAPTVLHQPSGAIDQSIQAPVKSKPLTGKRSLLWVGLVVLVVAIIGIAGFVFILNSNKASAENQSTSIAANNLNVTSTIEAIIPIATTTINSEAVAFTPTITATQELALTTAPEAPVTGGADKIAYLLDNDIWISNLDGTSPQQLTDDQAIKTGLQFTPDGKFIKYIVGKCAQSVDLETGAVEEITCFNFIDYLKAFEISPDGTKVAVSLDNQLYIVPFDLEKLKAVKVRSGLADLAECKDWAPSTVYVFKIMHWSKDSQALAVVVASNQGTDLIMVLDMSQCSPNPPVLDHFPSGTRLPIKNFVNYPEIQQFAWDGNFLFSLSTAIRNGGFGDLYTYNMELHKGKLAINPIEGRCCYRSPVFSPDGSMLLFAFQDIEQGSSSVTKFYYVEYGTLGSGSAYDPLTIPAFQDPKANPQPILRGIPSP